MTEKIKNLPASVMDRLRHKARVSNLTFNWVLKNYLNERFLYRLAQSQHCSKFVLKGGLIFFGWRTPLRRHTKDIDLRGYTQNTEANINQIIKDICNQPVEPDGVKFDADTITTEIITEQADYPGIRVHLWAFVGDRTREKMQIDIGFGDEITPPPTMLNYPTLLDMPEPRLWGYSKETVVAEKLHAILFRGSTTSRMKDFYDIWFIATNFDFEGVLLQEAIVTTFKTRNFPMPAELPYVLSDDYAKNHKTQWKAFLRTFANTDENVSNFLPIVQALRSFLVPVMESIKGGNRMDDHWNAGDRWMIPD